MTENDARIIIINKGRKKMIGKYFALARDLGVSSEDAKNKAKERFGLKSFNDITNDQLERLIRLNDRV
jgi:hypothetical protein